jgi:hypothetical protein
MKGKLRGRKTYTFMIPVVYPTALLGQQKKSENYKIICAPGWRAALCSRTRSLLTTFAELPHGAGKLAPIRYPFFAPLHDFFPPSGLSPR